MPARVLIAAVIAALVAIPLRTPSAALAASLGAYELVSVNSDELVGNGQSGDDQVAISDDGSVVAFLSESDNLVANDTLGQRDVFVRDIAAGTTTRVTVSDSGVEGNGMSFQPELTGDGRYVAFASLSDNLLDSPEADQNGPMMDAFLVDRSTGNIELISVNSDEVQGDSESDSPSVSADGRFVAFHSSSTNLATLPLDTVHAVYVRDRMLGTTVAVPNELGTCHVASLPEISADGRYVLYVARDDDCFGSGPMGVYLYDSQLGTTELVSLSDDEVPSTQINGAQMSSDTQYIVFTTVDNMTADDTDFSLDVFLRDRVLGTTEKVSTPMSGGNATGINGDPPMSRGGLVSDDGRFVAFESTASDLVPQDTNTNSDVFLRDRETGATSRINLTVEGLEANLGSGGGHRVALSRDASWIAFFSQDQFLAEDTNGFLPDVYRRDLHPAAPDSASDSADPGEPVTTDTETDGATPSDPVETTVTSPDGGAITIDESADPGSFSPPGGYAFLGGVVTIEAPIASEEFPLAIEFVIDPILHGGLTPEQIVIFRDGVAIEDCTLVEPPDPQPADPDPCIFTRSGNPFVDIHVTVLTSHASEWNFGFSTAAPEDVDPPQIFINAPADGATYTVGESVIADYFCDDGAGSGVAACDGDVPAGSEIDTSTVGSFSFTVVASDVAGNGTSAATSYEVVGFTFAGFFQPVDNGILNRVKAGQGVPVKFSLGGDQGLDIFEAGYPLVTQIACPNSTVDAIEQTVAGSTSSLTYNPTTGVYTYVFKTLKTWAGTCRQLELKLTDGTSHVAEFNFTR